MTQKTIDIISMIGGASHKKILIPLIGGFDKILSPYAICGDREEAKEQIKKYKDLLTFPILTVLIKIWLIMPVPI